MTYKSIIQILLIFAIISTICISIMKPKMHKPVMIYNSQFTLAHDDAVKIDEKNIAVMVQDTELKQDNQTSVENQGGINFVEPKIEDVKPITFKKDDIQAQNTGNLQNQKTNSSNNIGLKNSNSNIKTTPTKTSDNSLKQMPIKAKTQSTVNNQNPKIDLNKIVNNNQKIINTPSQTTTQPIKTSDTTITNKNVETSKPQTQVLPQQKPQETKQPAQTASQTTASAPKPVTTKTETQPVVLTAQQEEIAWNKWRSNLNNQIMKDSKLPTMPNGIIFKYKFTVDKYGKVSNVQTSSTTPGYTPYAIQFIAPVIRSYQGRAILNFPQGSKREYTEVSGAWKISSNSKLSTPDDYHDIEKVKQ